MKQHFKWWLLVSVLIGSIAGSLGCFTMAALDVNIGMNSIRVKPILMDTILAIGRPDAALLTQLQQPNALALIGSKQTYMVYEGGEDFVVLQQSSLVAKQTILVADKPQQIFLNDNQFWS